MAVPLPTVYAKAFMFFRSIYMIDRASGVSDVTQRAAYSFPFQQ